MPELSAEELRLPEVLPLLERADNLGLRDFLRESFYIGVEDLDLPVDDEVDVLAVLLLLVDELLRGESLLLNEVRCSVHNLDRIEEEFFSNFFFLYFSKTFFHFILFLHFSRNYR